MSTFKELMDSNFSITGEYFFDENGCQSHRWEDGAEEFTTIPFTGSGDYSGHCFDKANRLVLIEMFEEHQEEYDRFKENEGISEDPIHKFEEGEEWNHLSLGHGYEVICIKSNLSLDKIPYHILNTIESLSDHCVIDEDKANEVSQEVIEESWEYWAERDLVNSAENAAVKKVDCDGIAMESAICAWISIRAFDLYMDYCDLNNKYPETEGAESAHFPLLEECGQEIGEYFASRIVWC